MLYAFGLKLSGRSSWQRQPGQCCSHDWKRSPVACNPYCQYYKCEYPECTHTHTFNSPLSGTTRVSRYQKGKTNLDFTEARDSEWQWQQLGHMQVCTLLQTDNHASTPPLSFLQMPFLPPNQQCQSIEGHLSTLNTCFKNSVLGIDLGLLCCLLTLLVGRQEVSKVNGV